MAIGDVIRAFVHIDAIRSVSLVAFVTRASITVSFGDAGRQGAALVAFAGVESVAGVRRDVAGHGVADDLFPVVEDDEIPSNGQELLLSIRLGQTFGAFVIFDRLIPNVFVSGLADPIRSRRRGMQFAAAQMAIGFVVIVDAEHFPAGEMIGDIAVDFRVHS